MTQVIRSFRCKRTQALYDGNTVQEFQAFQLVALRKLDMIHAAASLVDLRIPPGNRLEALVGNRQGQHSIRINDQWRVCFVWNDGAHDVEIVDYH